MMSHRSRHGVRSVALALLATIAVGARCPITSLTDTVDGYEPAPLCSGNILDVRVAYAGSENTTSPSCGTGAQTAVGVDPQGGSARVSAFWSDSIADVLTWTCRHDVTGGPLPVPSVCEGSVGVDIDFFSAVTNPDGSKVPFTSVFLLVRSLVAGGPGGTLDAAVTATCGGVGIGDVTLPISRFGISRVPLAGPTDLASCEITIEFESRTYTDGLTVHSISVSPVRLGDECRSDAECGSTTPICGPLGICQPGDPGDPCNAPADCDSFFAPLCGPDRLCQKGRQGDACEGPWDCQQGCSMPVGGAVGTCE